MHEVTHADIGGEKEDEVTFWRYYKDPDMDSELDWQEIDDAVEDELGFLPDYDVN